jgi:hypothetical protein
VFWRSLWDEAASALRRTDEIVIIGYSLPQADDGVRDLLVRNVSLSSRVIVCSRGRSSDIAKEFEGRCGPQLRGILGHAASGWSLTLHLRRMTPQS